MQVHVTPSPFYSPKTAAPSNAALYYYYTYLPEDHLDG
jgi:hypothetical protein